MSGSSVKHEQLDTIAFAAGTRRPVRGLIARTALLAAVIDIRAQVDVSGGTTDGTLVREGHLRLVSNLKFIDGKDTPVDVQPRRMIQFARRRGMQVSSGVGLAAPGVQAATQIRQQIVIPFSDWWSRNPAEVFLKLKSEEEAYVQVEWAGAAAADLAAALITGGDRTVAVTNAAVDVMLVHDPLLWLQVAPLWLPRFKTSEQEAVQSTAKYGFEYKGANRLRAALLHSMDNEITTEGIITALGFRDQQTEYDIEVLARTWHEFEQFRYGGVDDETSVAMAYFFKDFAERGMLSKCYRPGQGAKPNFFLTVVGGANRRIGLLTNELEEVPGLTAAPANRPDWAL